MNSFKQKLNKLPQNVQDFFVSMKASELNSLICKNNNISENKIPVFLEIINKLFFKELEIKDLKNEILKSLVPDEKNAEKIIEQILGMRLLVVDDWFDGKVSEYLKKNQISENKYQKYVKEHKEAIKEEKAFFAKELQDDFEEYIPPKPKEEEEDVATQPYNSEKEKEDSKEIFSGMLSGFLAEHVNPFLEDYNSSLIQLFAEDSAFKGELEKLLFTNGEMLTHHHFELEGKPHSPTIGNWIQDFIAYNGSGIFTNLILTKYLTDSENVKRLPAEEKRLVQKLLQLYRNLKFFPESLENVPVEEWEIIPVNRDKGAPLQFKRPIGPPKTAEEKEIDKLKEREKDFAEDGLERLAIEEEIENKKRLEKLKIEANRYVPGSLERMAVEEEIRRLGT